MPRLPFWFWVMTIPLSVLIVANTLPYFTLSAQEPFLQEKGTLVSSPTWRISFYYHLAGASVCLLLGPVLLSAWALRRSRRLHRWLGWTYVSAVLCCAAPSGIYLSLYAKGGLPGQIGFLISGVAWFATTWAGLTAVRQGRLREHGILMVWSYALAWSAVGFRVFHLTLHELAVDREVNYVLSLWLSLLASVAVALYATRSPNRLPATPLGVNP